MELFGHFCPKNETPENPVARPHPAGDVPGPRTMDLVSTLTVPAEEPVKRRISLDSHENFSQLVFNASLVQLGPAKGVFNSLADVLDKNTIRLFRDWLSQQAHVSSTKGQRRGEATTTHDRRLEGSKMPNQVVWVDDKRTAGLDIAVEELRWRRDAPILMNSEDDEAVTYSLELKGESISNTISSSADTSRTSSERTASFVSTGAAFVAIK